MNIQDHLDLMRLHAKSIQEVFPETGLGRIPEINALLWGILDRVMQIENELLGTRYGECGEVGAKRGDAV